MRFRLGPSVTMVIVNTASCSCPVTHNNGWQQQANDGKHLQCRCIG